MSCEKRKKNLNTLAKITEKKKQLTPQKKIKMIKFGGIIKTKHVIDTYEICKEVRDR